MLRIKIREKGSITKALIKCPISFLFIQKREAKKSGGANTLNLKQDNEVYMNNVYRIDHRSLIDLDCGC